MRLSDLETGSSAVIIKILGHGAFRRRVMEMGFVKGREITAVLNAPLRDPVKYRLMDYEVSLRRSEASMIEVVPVDEYAEAEKGLSFEPMVANDSDDMSRRLDASGHTINIALIGNPNCGKTSLFNIASGAQEHVGNYSGVTVDCKYGTFRHKGYKFNIVDLPGTYSLSAYSPEELYVRRYLTDSTPDVIVNVADASNLERNLYLTTELIDMDHSMVIALNLYDELRNRGDKLDYATLGGMIGVPIVPTVSRTGEGIEQLFDTIIEVYEGRNKYVRHVHVKLGHDIEEAIDTIKPLIKTDPQLSSHFSARYLAIKLLEGDPEADKIIENAQESQQIKALRDKAVAHLAEIHDEDVATMVANEKYGFISGALAETLQRNEKEKTSTSHIIDAFVTNRLFGFPIFIAIMFFIFWVTFYIGQIPMGWIDSGCNWLADIVNDNMADGPLKDLLADGIIGGVGGVIVFLPNILILYFFISFMEDSGYMARAAFIMDKIMHKIGLHGKSFIPLVMGFGCNVPAVMACRTIESRSSRLITIMINPFVSCSARLPIYVLLIGTFFSTHAALVFLLMYVLGVTVAVVTARLLRRFVFKVDETPFVMELPPYRVPTLKSSLRHMWWKAQQYLRKMGGIILVASIVVWALNYFPHHDPAEETATEATESTAGSGDGGSDMPAPIADSESIDPEHDSFLEMIGKAINPVFRPLGFSWRASVAVVAGVPAKEIVVSTLGVLYTGDEDSDDNALSARLTAPDSITGQPDFNPAVALAFMVFILLYCPCIATLVAIVKETHSWKYGIFAVVYNTAVAWVAAFIVYRIALLF
ncbi:MAG: ferrous iron transport protein B [Bacteroidales bacterium]|nr:ferrous iron transport protein B [Bacteroidales bacterium]